MASDSRQNSGRIGPAPLVQLHDQGANLTIGRAADACSGDRLDFFGGDDQIVSACQPVEKTLAEARSSLAAAADDLELRAGRGFFAWYFRKAD